MRYALIWSVLPPTLDRADQSGICPCLPWRKSPPTNHSRPLKKLDATASIENTGSVSATAVSTTRHPRCPPTDVALTSGFERGVAALEPANDATGATMA